MFLFGMLLFTSCDDDEPMIDIPGNETATFTVTIDNIITPTPFSRSQATGAIPPGEAQTFSFDAGRGQSFSFSSMFVQTNDVFFAFEPTGLSLYDNSGNPISGDVTDQVMLWDAGTEVNQEPGVGADQAPRQAEPNTGTEENGVIRNLNDVDDGYTYPAVSDLIRVAISNDGGTRFSVTITNVSDAGTLPSPISPGVLATHAADARFFTVGEPAANGMEEIAEDGNNEPAEAYLTANTGYVSGFAPGAYAVHEFDEEVIFEENQKAPNNGLEELAEDADPSILNTTFTENDDITSNGVFNTPVGMTSAGPALPGNSYEFTFTATEGERLNFATMLGNTNDLFFAFDEDGMDLFDNGTPITGDVTNQIQLWDAGTEVNEIPGIGNNQAPRQAAPDSGTTEDEPVQVVNDEYTYPAVNSMIRVTVSAQ